MRRIDTEMNLTATQGRCRCISVADISFNTDENSKEDIFAGAIKTKLGGNESKATEIVEENKLQIIEPGKAAVCSKVESKKSFKFLYAANCIPRKGTKGEDAYFVTLRALGVADGVSGWYQYKIDAAKFSQELMSNCHKEIMNKMNNSSSLSIDLVEILTKAYGDTQSIGSSTATLITINEDSLHGLNLGDSGFVCFTKRGGEYVCHGVSKEKQHDFNTPFQLCNVPSEEYIAKLREVIPEGDVNHLVKVITQHDLCQDSPSDGDRYAIKLHQDDIVVMGTDGTSLITYRLL
jgi:serine/threonine protein phosphatase PrpC